MSVARGGGARRRTGCINSTGLAKLLSFLRTSCLATSTKGQKVGVIGTGIKAALDRGGVQVAAGEFGVNLFVIVVLARVGGDEACRHQDCSLEAGGSTLR